MTKNEKAIPDKSSDNERIGKAPPAGQKPPLGGKSPEKNRQKEQNKANWSLRILAVLLIFMSGAAASIYFIPSIKDRIPAVARWIGDDQSDNLVTIRQTLTSQQAEINALKQRSEDIEERLTQTAQTPSLELPQNLESRISVLEQALNAAPEPEVESTSNAQDTSQSTRIDMLLSRMSQLEASFVPLSKSMIDAANAEKERQALIIDSASLEEKVAELESRLVDVEQVAAKDNSAILLNIKVAELKRKLRAGIPYTVELQSVQDLLDGSSLSKNQTLTAAIARLSANASTGVKTADQIRHTFNALIPQLLRTEGIDETASWWQNTLTSVKNIITVRKTDGTSSNDNSIDGPIATIEGWLRDDNFEAALDAVEQLPGSFKTILSPWSTDVKSWLQCQEAINSLESAAAESYLTTANSPPPEVIS